MINSLPGNCVEKARALNLPFAGSRDSDHGEFGNEEDFSCLWSSSSVGDDMARYVYLQRVLSNAFDGWNDR